MRILYDSKKLCHKDPFGTLTPNETCTLHVHIPQNVGALKAECVIRMEQTGNETIVTMLPSETVGPYVVFSGSFSLTERGLYFYYFRVHKPDSSFRLFKQGDDTNMEAGSLWQLSCVPADFTTPDWAKGATIYQVFPDRFYKHGDCDLTGKLEPYTVHKCWNEEVVWKPDAHGEVLNNDFYGGNFKGITEKMGYIAEMGATILYLNPISKSFSSHRYDTGDYKVPDPMLGTEEDFVRMCEEAHKHGIKVVLDGVYSHTGSNSLYFDRNGTFGGKGAYCTKESPYYSWYQFYNYPNSYNSWWGFHTLPTVNKMDPAFLDFIIDAEDSVVAHWLKLGADGFRLDVADELPDAFILRLKKRIRAIKPDAFLMGEVWEDASNKVAYGEMRCYCTGDTLDSVMNYPLRTALIDFATGKINAWDFTRLVKHQAEVYPAQFRYSLMNLVGSHDRPRALNMLVDRGCMDLPKADQQWIHLTVDEYNLAVKRYKMCVDLLCALPGCPTIYYGDEAGLCGCQDPWNRRPFPWGKEDKALQRYVSNKLTHRRQSDVLKYGLCDIEALDADTLTITRYMDGSKDALGNATTCKEREVITICRK